MNGLSIQVPDHREDGALQSSNLFMSPFLEFDMGHRRFNRNGTALIQIMGIDREQVVMK